MFLKIDVEKIFEDVIDTVDSKKTFLCVLLFLLTWTLTNSNSMGWPSCRQIVTEDASASYGPCVMLRLQPVCIFKYVVSDSRYCTCSKDLWDSGETAKSYKYCYSCYCCCCACSKAMKICRICAKEFCWFIYGPSQTWTSQISPPHTSALCLRLCY